MSELPPDELMAVISAAVAAYEEAEAAEAEAEEE
jgi:hypothetical protein